MIRHRCPTLSRPRAFLSALLAAAALLAAPARAQNVQVYINALFVANPALSPVAGGNTCSFTSGVPLRYFCPLNASNAAAVNVSDISADPHIEFDQDPNSTGRCALTAGKIPQWGNPPVADIDKHICNDEVFLCTQVGTSTSGIVLDKVTFELFKFQDGSNPLDPSSTPPLRTLFIDAPGTSGTTDLFLPNSTSGYCVLWDGSVNIQGELGKTNGMYGFRVTVVTNQVSPTAGNITITDTKAYPASTVLVGAGNPVPQRPVTVDVTNLHVVRSSPTVVGAITGVAAEPYNFTYRLSKDAITSINVTDSVTPYTSFRTVLNAFQRTGEGTPTGTLQNGDFWDGRDDNGNFLPAGNYLVNFNAKDSDQYTAAGKFDDALTVTRQIAIDPLQVTDLRVQPLLGGSTSLAVLSYMLTEPSTVYIDIYPPGTQFCSGLNNVTGATDVPGFGQSKSFGGSLDNCATNTLKPLRSLTEVKTFRTSVISFWDGRDNSGTVLPDGDYVFVIYASLPSQKGAAFNGNANDKRIWTTVGKTGFIAVARGLPGITQVTPTSTVIGSSPAIAGLNPFTFRYSMTRDATVSVKIFDATGTRLIKTLVNKENRPGSFPNQETWFDGTDDSGLAVASGTYIVQLTAADPAYPQNVSTTTAQFPVNLVRITDIAVSPLLAGASDNVTLNYQLSQPMFVAWNIYAPGSIVDPSNWPPCPTQTPPNACTSATVKLNGTNAAPLVTFRGMRPGRLRISEFWDGRDSNGLFVPDGNYVFTLTAQSTTTPQYFATDKIFGTLTVARGSIVFTQYNVLPDSPQLFNSSNTIELNPFTINYALTRQSSVTIQVLNTNIPPTVVRTIVAGGVRPAALLQTDIWDGRDDKGNFPPSGFYLVRAVAQDVASVLASGSTAQLTIAFDPLRIYDLAITPLRQDSREAVISYQVSETMKVAIKIFKPGTVFDPAGNPSPPESVSLVKRIVGVRPARTQIEDVWDGTDFTMSPVPDGNYRFKIVASTDITAIDNVTGDVLAPTELSLDRPIDEVPVVRGSSLEPRQEFENFTFSYPNPATAPTVTFQIYMPFRGKARLRLHTMSGELVLDRDLGESPASFQAGPVQYVWNKTNQSGHKIARGMYFAVIRAEETEGGANVLQTVKKVLIP